mgnify:CR=1 FL=1
MQKFNLQKSLVLFSFITLIGLMGACNDNEFYSDRLKNINIKTTGGGELIGDPPPPYEDLPKEPIEEPPKDSCMWVKPNVTDPK